MAGSVKLNMDSNDKNEGQYVDEDYGDVEHS